MTARTFTFTVQPPPPTGNANWAERSTGPGVVWAHNFEEEGELTQHLFSADTVYNYTAADQFRPTLVPAPELGATAKAVGSRTWAAVIAETIPAVPELTAGTIRVNDASAFPNPAAGPYGKYSLYIGNGYVHERVEVLSINYATNTLSVIRGQQLEGSANDIAPQHVDGTPIGCAPSCRWNRIMMPFAAGQNGKSAPDIGIANGFRTATWAQSTTKYGQAHSRWRRGFWGHPAAYAKYNAQWPPADYATTGWAPPTTSIPTVTDCFAHPDPAMCGEFWFQYRMKVPAAKFTDVASKLIYIQTAHQSMPQQIFCTLDGRSASYEDRIIPAYNFNGPIWDYASVMKQPGWFRIPPDEWVTYMVHIIPGRGVREWPEYSGDRQGGAPEMTIEMFAARANQSTFTKYATVTNWRGRYGYPAPDGSHNTAPPAYNVVNPANYPNTYVGSGSSGAPFTNHELLFAQCILSRYEIPCPTPLV
jgi:hypothetical protein